MEENNNKIPKKDKKVKNYYNYIEFLSIIGVIIFQTLLNFFIDTQYYLINAGISFIIIYVIKFFIDRHLNFHNKWEEFIDDNFFYVLYGLIATGSCVIYIGIQYVLKYNILFPILAGGAVLTAKKIVDQEYTFFFNEKMREIILYGFFAIFTTIIFWGIQYILTLFIGEQYYIITGAIGLAIGYTIKFLLDKLYVFKKKYGSSSQQTMFYVLYIFFGFISSVVNLVVQWILGYNLIGLFSGTVAGFVVKYILDKFIVFRN